MDLSEKNLKLLQKHDPALANRVKRHGPPENVRVSLSKEGLPVPQIAGTIVVVWTTITLTVLRVFDIVFAMTNGQWETQVLANYMYAQLFVANDWGVGSAAAIIIMLLVSPILVWNVWNVRKEMR